MSLLRHTIKLRSAARVCLGLASLSLWLHAGLAFAQYQPGRNYNMTKLAQLDQYGGYSGVWGYTDNAGREYALLGTDQGLSIVNVTDPRNPREVDSVPGTFAPPYHWREIKVRGNHAYIVSEGTAPSQHAGIQVLDLSPLPDSVRYVGAIIWPGVSRALARGHTISVDNAGYLYVNGGSATRGAADEGGVRIFSLNNPALPLTASTIGARYVHDSFVKNNLLFNCNIVDGGRVEIYDIANRAAPRLVTALVYPQGFSHNTETTEDGNYLITTDEIEHAPLKIWDIRVLWDGNPNNDNQIDLVAQYLSDPEHIAHNVHVRGNHAFVAHYTEGVTVLEISDPTKPVEIGYYDTIDELVPGFNGVWDSYPHFPSGNLVAADMTHGLFVLKLEQNLKGGDISGFVLDKANGNPIAQAEVKLLEADKLIAADGGGSYAFRTFEGAHTVIASAFGYLPDTLRASVTAGGETTLIFQLELNTAAMAVSVDSIKVELEVDKSAQQKFVVRNNGGGVLNFGVRDLAGPFPAANLAAQTPGVSWSRFQPTPAQLAEFVQAQPRTQHALAADLKTIITDPAGDAVRAPDVVAIRADKDDTKITVQVVLTSRIVTNNFGGAISLDVDQDQSTGLFPPLYGVPTQDLGAEFAVLTFTLANGVVQLYETPSFNDLGFFPATVDSNSFTFSLPLAVLHNDDGNMNVTALFGDFQSETDWVPDVGHGTIGIDVNADVLWLTETPNSGSLRSGQSQEITMNFNATGLRPDTTYTGVVLVEPIGIGIPPHAVQIKLKTKAKSSSVDEKQAGLPKTFALAQNYPNPFNPSTVIGFQLPVRGEVSLAIYDLEGRLVKQAARGNFPAGEHSVVWDGKNDAGARVASGVYVYKFTTGAFVAQKKLVLMK